MLKLQSWAWQGGELFDRVTHVKRFTEMDALTPETLQGGTASWSYTVFKYLLSFRWVMDLYVTIASAQAADAIEQMLLALNYIHSHGLWAQRVALGINVFFPIGCVSPCSLRFGSEEKNLSKNKQNV